MASVEPLDILVKALKVAWNAAAGLTGLNGPYRDEKPPDLSVGFPYVIVKAECRLRGWTCQQEYYEHDITFWVYDTTPELVAAHVTTIKTVFDSEALAITLSSGDLVQKRPEATKYERLDKTVWRASSPYFFVTSRPRVA